MKLLDLSPRSVGISGEDGIPGLSFCSRNQWIHGEEALNHCRTDPQSACPDVWEDLSLEPVTPSAGMRHRADLAVAQIRKLGLDPEDTYVAAVPANWSREVLQVFLGVAQECRLTIEGLFPRALAAAALSRPDADTCTVIELGWKALQISTVTSDGGSWHLTGRELHEELGVFPLFRQESRLAAGWMLKHHRVDPLYSGKTEQQLFDAWWAWRSGEVEAWLVHAGAQQISLSGEIGELKNRRPEIVASFEAPLIGSGSASGFLGLTADEIESPDLSPALAGLDLPPGKGPRWRDHLAKTCSPSPRSPDGATHVVVEGVAEPLAGDAGGEPGNTITLPDGREGVLIRFRDT